MDKKILLCLAHMSGNEMKYIQEAFDTDWVVPLGPNVNRFESLLETYVNKGTPQSKVVALASGTAAIHLALIATGVKAGDEVMVQSFTFCASANPVRYAGATPVFVDSERDTWNMDPDLLEEAIKDRIKKTGHAPKAIIPVTLYGMPYKIDRIMEIAKRYGIDVIEDSAEGLGSLFRDRMMGTFGRYGILSFNGNKMITTSGGGAVICNAMPGSTDYDVEAQKKRILYLSTQSRLPFPYYQHTELGYNYRMSNICAGIGCGQMTVLDSHIEHHRHVHDLYVEQLRGMDCIEVKSEPNGDFRSNYWLTTVTLKDHNPELLRQHLEKHGIESRPLWKPMHLQPLYEDCPAYINGVSESIFDTGLCLPSGPRVSDEDIAYITRTIKEFLG